MTSLLVVRHGQSEWNALGRWQGQADPPLSALGRLQAAHAATRLEAIDVVVASDLERAHHTARIIATELGTADVRTDPAFRERHAGEWQGLTKEEIDVRYPGYLDQRRRPPGFESDESLTARVQEGLHRVLDAHAGARVLVVSHGGVIYRLEQSLGAPFERIPNLAGRWLHAVDGRALALGDRVVLVGEDEVTVPGQL